MSPGPTQELATHTIAVRAVAAILAAGTTTSAVPAVPALPAVVEPHHELAAVERPRVLLYPAPPAVDDRAEVAAARRARAGAAATTRPTAGPAAAAAGHRRTVTRAAAATATRRPAPRPRRGVSAPTFAAVASLPAGSAELAVAWALAQVGKPYRWAAAGPGAFDCSGLVVASFARLGLNLPHQTGSLIRRGAPVARSQLRRGDLVFPSSGHVGIYLGGGMMVHAPKPGDHVRVAPVYAFYAGRRIA